MFAENLKSGRAHVGAHVTDAGDDLRQGGPGHADCGEHGLAHILARVAGEEAEVLGDDGVVDVARILQSLECGDRSAADSGDLVLEAEEERLLEQRPELVADLGVLAEAIEETGHELAYAQAYGLVLGVVERDEAREEVDRERGVGRDVLVVVVVVVLAHGVLVDCKAEDKLDATLDSGLALEDKEEGVDVAEKVRVWKVGGRGGG